MKVENNWKKKWKKKKEMSFVWKMKKKNEEFAALGNMYVCTC